jgi:hypothetical protein
MSEEWATRGGEACRDDRNEVQASEAEGLEGAKTGGAHSPMCGAMENSNEPKQILSPRLARPEVLETKAIRSSGWWTNDVISPRTAPNYRFQKWPTANPT